MKNQAFNPYLPSWEYIPDGEPHVFGDRVYVYGSHDYFNGNVFCLGDYVCYSAPVTDLSDWKYEGVIYKKTTEEINADGHMCLYAPDVTQGPDGRYYLYYVYDKVGFVSVAVCDTPAGKYEFYGHVHYKDGSRLGERKGDISQFDPAVITEGDKTYLYTGFCGYGMKDRIGAMATVLDKDMLTIIEEPVIVAPSVTYSDVTERVEIGCPYKQDSIENWKEYKGHEFFEGPSIRKIGDTYYLVYSSIVMHELCYATSKNPTSGFKFQGVIVSNADLHIDRYKKAEMPAAYGANNHGGFECINGEYYIFYHRHTNGTWYCRQGCAEKIKINNDGTINQVEITSCGLNNGPLKGKGEYPAYIACNLFLAKEPVLYIKGKNEPLITQEGRDGDEELGFIDNVTDSTTIGFKYFDFKDTSSITITVRGYSGGTYEVKTELDGPTLGKVEIENQNIWHKYKINAKIPDGVHALYLVYTGGGNHQLKCIDIE